MVKLLIIGCGAVLEQLYLRPLLELQRRGWLRVYGAVDPVEARRELAAKWFKFAKVFPDSETAFSRLGFVGLTIIASPPACHRTEALIALGHDSNVFCEKPMAHSVAAAGEMVEAAKVNGRLLGVGMVRRFYPAVEVARQMIQSGVLGTPIRFHYREGGAFGWPVTSPALFHRDTAGGGVLLDKGIHALDLLFHLFGPGLVMESADDALAGNCVETNALLKLRFGAALGTLTLSWDMPLNNGLHVVGPEAEVWLPMVPIGTVWKRRNSADAVWQKVRPGVRWAASLDERNPKLCQPQSVEDCFRLQLVAMLRSIFLGTPLSTAADEAVEALRLAAQAYDQATPLAKPWLGPDERRENEQAHWHSLVSQAA